MTRAAALGPYGNYAPLPSALMRDCIRYKRREANANAGILTGLDFVSDKVLILKAFMPVRFRRAG